MPTETGRPIVLSSSAPSPVATVALPPGQHSLCYNHKPTQSSVSGWRLLAPDLEVFGAASWAPASPIRAWQRWLALVHGHGLSSGDRYDIVAATVRGRRRAADCTQLHTNPLRVTADMFVNRTVVLLPLVLGSGSFSLCYFVQQSGWHRVCDVLLQRSSQNSGRPGRLHRGHLPNVESAEEGAPSPGCLCASSTKCGPTPPPFSIAVHNRFL